MPTPFESTFAALAAWINPPVLLGYGGVALLAAASFALGALSRMPPGTRLRRLGIAFGLAGLLAAHGLGWLALQGFREQAAQARQQAANEARAADVLAWLAQRCESERRLAPMSEADRVPTNEGVLLDIAQVRRPVVDDVPPVDWFEPLGAAQVLAASMFVFVEQDLRMTSRGAISVTAHRLWWESFGRGLVPPATAEEFAARLAQVDLFHAIEGPVRQSTARYQLTLRDASTPVDRSHGVARIELQLVDRRRGATLAEYVGFAADLLPGMRGGRGPAWRGIRTCSGPEQSFTTADAGFDVIGFFLQRAVRVARDRPRLMT